MRARLWGRLMPPEKEDYVQKIQQEKVKVQAVIEGIYISFLKSSFFSFFYENYFIDV